MGNRCQANLHSFPSATHLRPLLIQPEWKAHPVDHHSVGLDTHACCLSGASTYEELCWCQIVAGQTYESHNAISKITKIQSFKF